HEAGSVATLPDDPRLRTLVRNRGVIETLEVPRVRRRGSSGRVATDPASWASLVNSSSLTTAIQRASRGRIAVVHQDYRRTGSILGPSRVFISIISADRKQACVDGLVTQDGEGPQSVAFRQDTLFVLQKRRISGSRTLGTELKTYVIDDTKCNWIPMAHGSR